jgi:ribosomal protein L17
MRRRRNIMLGKASTVQEITTDGETDEEDKEDREQREKIEAFTKSGTIQKVREKMATMETENMTQKLITKLVTTVRDSEKTKTRTIRKTTS